MADIAFEKDLKVEETGIGGLKVLTILMALFYIYYFIDLVAHFP